MQPWIISFKFVAMLNCYSNWLSFCSNFCSICLNCCSICLNCCSICLNCCSICLKWCSNWLYWCSNCSNIHTTSDTLPLCNSTLRHLVFQQTLWEAFLVPLLVCFRHSPRTFCDKFTLTCFSQSLTFRFFPATLSLLLQRSLLSSSSLCSSSSSSS